MAGRSARLFRAMAAPRGPAFPRVRTIGREDRERPRLAGCYFLTEHRKKAIRAAECTAPQSRRKMVSPRMQRTGWSPFAPSMPRWPVRIRNQWPKTAKKSAIDSFPSCFRLARLSDSRQFGEQLSRQVQFADRVESLGSLPELLPDRERLPAVVGWPRQNPFGCVPRPG